ncbi:hypothetical protein CTH30272_03305 [Allocatenococcus thiocycli]|nr:hypothetical protein CTH30272_03305 [Catenococcus thiocycli]
MNSIIKIMRIASFRVFAAAVGFIFNIVLNRKLGINDAGLYYAYVAVVEFGVVIFSLGLVNIILKNSSRASGEKQSEKIGFLLSSLAIILIVYLVFLLSELVTGQVVLSLANENLITYKNYLYISIICLIFSRLIGVYLQGRNRVNIFIFISSVSVPLILIISFLVFNIREVSEAIKFYCISVIGTLIIAGYFCLSSNIKNIKLSYKREDYNGLSAFWITSIMTAITTSGLVIIMSKYLENSDIAILSVSNKVVFLLSFILSTISIVYAPKIGLLKSKNDMPGVFKLYIDSTKIILYISIPVVILCTYFSTNILNFFGEDYSEGKLPFLIVLYGQFINISVGIVWTVLNLTGYERVVKNAVLFFSILSLCALPYLSAHYGVVGAASVIFIFTAGTNIYLFIYTVRIYFKTIR